MKAIIITIVLISAGLFCSAQQISETGNMRYNIKYSNKDYKEAYNRGTLINGKRDGEWIELSVDSIVYSTSSYNHGVPIGTWRLNFPSGSIRVKKKFTNEGDLYQWSRYKHGKPIIVLHSDSVYLNQIMRSLDNYEEQIFQTKLKEFESGTNITREETYEYSSRTYSTVNMSYNELADLYSIPDIFKEYANSCSIKLFLTSGNLRTEYFINQEHEVEKISYGYKNKNITKKYFYHQNRLDSIQIYNKKGYVKTKTP